LGYKKKRFIFAKNNFKLNDNGYTHSFVFSTEQQEKENLKRLPNDSVSLYTRQMFFDIMRLL